MPPLGGGMEITMKKLFIGLFILTLTVLVGCGVEGSPVKIELKGEASVDLVVLVDEPNYAVSEMAKAFAEKLSEYTGKTVEIEEFSNFRSSENVYPIYIDTVKEDGSNLPSFDVHLSAKEADMITWVDKAIETYSKNYEFIFEQYSAQIIAPDEYWLYFALDNFLGNFKNEIYSVIAGTRNLYSGNLLNQGSVPMTPAQLITEAGEVQFLFTEHKVTFVYDRYDAQFAGTALLVDGDGRDGMQGACTDGKYAYYALYEDDIANIYKFDLKTWELVDVSEEMPTGHSNDMTYIPEKNQLMVAGSTPENGWFAISYVDAETLEYLGQETLPYSCGGIQYLPEQEKFVIQNCYDYNICDSDFNLIKNFTCGYSKDTDQGLYCDGTYIYDSRWGEKDAADHSGQNHLLIHDLEGNFISHGEIHGDPCKDESENENVFIHNNFFYIGYYNSPRTINEYIMVPVNMFE